MRKLMCALVLAGCSPNPPTPPPPTDDVVTPTGVVAWQQSERGRRTFEARCVECHELDKFIGDNFLWSWEGYNAWDLFQEVSVRMPEDFPGDLEPQQYVDIITYFLRINGYETGGPVRVPTAESLSDIPLGMEAPRSRRARLISRPGRHP